MPNEQRFAAAAAAREAMLAGSAPAVPTTDPSVSRRPWEVVVAAVLGAVAPLFVLLALTIAAFTGGRVLRVLGWALHGIGDSTEAAGVSAAGDVTAFLANVILFVGVVAGVVVMIGFHICLEDARRHRAHGGWRLCVWHWDSRHHPLSRCSSADSSCWAL